MGEYTDNLQLYKGTPGSTTETFNVQTMLNDNWDKLNEADKENVKKETGKGLSSNDYTDEDKAKVNNISNNLQSEVDTHIDDDIIHITQSEREIWNNKVDKEEGKGLSTNDYTDEDKDKVNNAVTATNKETATIGQILQANGDGTSTFVDPRTFNISTHSISFEVPGKSSDGKYHPTIYEVPINGDYERLTAIVNDITFIFYKDSTICYCIYPVPTSSVGVYEIVHIPFNNNRNILDGTMDPN